MIAWFSSSFHVQGTTQEPSSIMQGAWSGVGFLTEGGVMEEPFDGLCYGWDIV